MPRVSVIIPTYNCANFIERTLQSVIEQTYTDYEIIVVDDGSTDETATLLAKWEDKIHYVYQPNRGLPSARNLAVANSCGEYLAYLDADDMWYPNKLEQTVEYLDAHPECGLVHSDITCMDEQDQKTTPFWYKEKIGLAAQGHCLLELLHRNVIHVLTVVERRTCFDKTGGFDERFRRVEDYKHWSQIALDGHAMGYLDVPLAKYRCRSGSLSGNEAAMLEALIQMFHLLETENALYEREPAAKEIVNTRVRELKRDLLHTHRRKGALGQAAKRMVAQVRNNNTAIYAHYQVLKARIPERLICTLFGR